MPFHCQLIIEDWRDDLRTCLTISTSWFYHCFALFRFYLFIVTFRSFFLFIFCGFRSFQIDWRIIFTKDVFLALSKDLKFREVKIKTVFRSSSSIKLQTFEASFQNFKLLEIPIRHSTLLFCILELFHQIFLILISASLFSFLKRLLPIKFISSVACAIKVHTLTYTIHLLSVSTALLIQ